MAKLNQLRRTRGSMRALYALARRILRLLPISGRWASIYAGDLWQLDLEKATRAQADRLARIPKSFQIRMAAQEDLAALAAYYGNEQTIRKRLERGDWCFMTVCQDRIGAAAWVVPGPGECREDWAELHTMQRFPAGIAWSYDGKGTRWGAWGALMIQLPDLLKERGIRTVVTLIDCDNWKSYDAHRSLGYEITGLIGSAGLLGVLVGVCRQHANRRWQFLPARVKEVEVF